MLDLCRCFPLVVGESRDQMFYTGALLCDQLCESDVVVLEMRSTRCLVWQFSLEAVVMLSIVKGSSLEEEGSC